MTTPPLAMPAPALPGAQLSGSRQPRAQEDLLAPSIWSDRARLLARPDVVAVELLLLVTAAVLLRDPLTEALGTAPVPAAPSAPAPPAAPVSPLALVPVAPPAAARHEPRDPFAPLVTSAQPADGAPPATVGTGTAAPATSADTSTAGTPSTATPTTGTPTPPALTTGTPAASPTDTAAPSRGATITIKPGDTLNSVAREHGLSWQVLYEANRQVVGADPNLVRPGAVLTLP